MEIEERRMHSGVIRKRENRGSPPPRKHKQQQVNICKKASPVDFDVMSEILARLPVISVTRFQLVCKSWRSLISSDYFHSLRKSPPPLFLTVVQWRNSSRVIIKTSELFYLNRRIIERGTEKQRTIPRHIFKLDIKIFDHYIFDVERFSNGLLLMYYRVEYYVYNPTTDHSEKIPQLNECIPSGNLHLLFDPFKSPHYKIVLIRGLQFNVFNSESGTWSVCVRSETMTHYKTLFYFIYCGHLYCFNIVKNVSQYIVCPLPQVADQIEVYSCTLQEYNGSLYYCAFVRDVAYQSAVLWELQLNGRDDPRLSNWLLKYHHKDTGPPDPLLGRLPNWPVYSTLAFVTETSTVFVCICRKIMAYSFLYKTYTEVVDIHGDFVHVHQIGETLALP